MFALFLKALLSGPFTMRHSSMDWDRPGTHAARDHMPW